METRSRVLNDLTRRETEKYVNGPYTSAAVVSDRGNLTFREKVSSVLETRSIFITAV